jgi:hypothetical protein
MRLEKPLVVIYALVAREPATMTRGFIPLVASSCG